MQRGINGGPITVNISKRAQATADALLLVIGMEKTNILSHRLDNLIGRQSLHQALTGSQYNQYYPLHQNHVCKLGYDLLLASFYLNDQHKWGRYL
jgi:hypothetical protein